jgi:hypothetical protein
VGAAKEGADSSGVVGLAFVESVEGDGKKLDQNGGVVSVVGAGCAATAVLG